MLNQITNLGNLSLQIQRKKGKDSCSKQTNSHQHNNTTLAKVPFATMQAYAGNISFAGRERIAVKFINSLSADELIGKYGQHVKSDIKNLLGRVGRPGQFTNWIDILPKDQIRRLNDIYGIVNTLKTKGGNGKLGVIGIGGSRHTIENMLTLSGHQDKVVFLSATDPESIKRFLNKLGDLKTANIMVASKSGTTLEPSVGYEEVEKVFLKEFTKKFQSEEGLSYDAARRKAKKEVANHFVGITDANPATSKLRQIVTQKGYQSDIIHDDCGGRFGSIDGHSLVALAYAGMPKDQMERLLKGTLAAQKKFTSTDLTKNLAAQRAMFNVDSILKGKTNEFDYYFGDVFEGTPLWNVQLKRESHKANYFPSDSVGPAFLHYAAESDLDAANKTSFYTFTTLANNGSKKFQPYNAINQGVLKAYSDRHPVSHVELKNLSPESIAEFIELKHFETMYTGMLLRSVKGESHPAVLPEVLQPNVEIYKKEVKAAIKAMDQK